MKCNREAFSWLVRGMASDMWDCLNGRSDNFFAWGGGTISHPPVLLIEDDCAALTVDER